MNAYEFILTKQIQWAKNHEINLIGSKVDRGRRAYTKKLNDNLFQPLLPRVKVNFENGDGNELAGYPSKMQAVHSSSALGLNIFQYWINENEISKIAYACRFCNKETRISEDIIFEKKYQIDKKFRFRPNIDVVIKNDSTSKYKVFAIECKFSEAYTTREHSGVKKKYLELDIWEDIPAIKKLAHRISPKDNDFQYLHSAQLIKHILALKKAFGKKGFRLVYLWYNVPGLEGAKHQEEISKFTEIINKDEIYFHALSYQDLISKLAKSFRNNHREYIEYITYRYL